jgi:hypothetical protein
MNIVLNILFVIGGIVALALLVALFMRKRHFVKREILINAPNEKVFEFLRHLKNQDKFNTHAMAGGERETKFTGTDGTVGYIYAWKGNKDAGEGEKEIKNIVEGKRIETEIRFVKPMAAKATIVMETIPLSAGKTKVSWSNAGVLKYPVNILVPMVERSLPKEMDKSLLTLKRILEV